MRSFAAFLMSCLVLASCSVPTDETAEVIPQENLPETLRRVAAPTTTTTLLTADALDVTYYLLFQPEDQEQRKVRPVVRSLPTSTSLSERVELMFAEDFVAGSEDDELFNQVTQYLFVDVALNSSVATVILDFVDAENPPGDEGLRDAAAQLAWTLTDFASVDAILIEIAGELQGLPTDDGGNEDRPVTTDDYLLYAPEPPDDSESDN